MFFLTKLRKNDLNSKFILRLRLVFIKNLMSKLYKYCYLYAFVWIFKIVSLFNYQSPLSLYCFSASQLRYSIIRFCLCQQLFKFLFQQNQRRNRDLNPGAGSPDLLPFQGSPFSLLGISPRLTHKPYKTEKVGFEPTVPFRITGFQDRLFKPLRHLSSGCLQLRQLNQFNI